MAYSYQGSMEKAAKAFARDENASWKDCNEVCHSVKGMGIEPAIKYLEMALEKKEFIPFRRYSKGKGHRSKGQAGGWPVKSIKIVKALLENAKSNAEHKGLNVDKVKIAHATAYKTRTLSRIKPKGGVETHDIDLATVEVVVKEV